VWTERNKNLCQVLGQFEQRKGLRSYMLVLSLAPVLQEDNSFEDIHRLLELATGALCREATARRPGMNRNAILLC